MTNQIYTHESSLCWQNMGLLLLHFSYFLTSLFIFFLSVPVHLALQQHLPHFLVLFLPAHALSPLGTQGLCLTIPVTCDDFLPNCTTMFPSLVKGSPVCFLSSVSLPTLIILRSLKENVLAMFTKLDITHLGREEFHITQWVLLYLDALPIKSSLVCLGLIYTVAMLCHLSKDLQPGLVLNSPISCT